jgi:hypothetical protein
MTTMRSIEAFLANERLAVVGASRGGRGFGNAAARELADEGYRIELVHPEAESIDGRRCHRSLRDVPDDTRAALFVVPPASTRALVEDADAAGIRHVWMQQGSGDPEAIRACVERGIDVVHGECILMFAAPKGLHAFHRCVWRWLGKLPPE